MWLHPLPNDGFIPILDRQKKEGCVDFFYPPHINSNSVGKKKGALGLVKSVNEHLGKEDKSS